MKREYTSKDIKVLSELDHIRANPGMYVGQTSDPVHLLEEALDNALDEALAGYANIIAINIDTKTNMYSVLDNGRGIPIDNDTAVIISTKLFSGGKFEKSGKSAYEIACGLHGVGLVAVNALSDFLTIEIYRDGKHALYTFDKATLKDKKIEDFKDKAPFSSKIQFRPDKKVFEKLVPDIDRIRRRLLVASIELQNCTFVLNVDEKKDLIKLNKNEYFKTSCLSDSESEVSSVINIEVDDDSELLRVMMCHSFSGSPTPKISSSINLLPVESGGSHVSYYMDIIKELFSTRAKKAGFRMQPQDCFFGLRSYISLSLKKPEFSGQTKDKLINRKSYLDKLFQKFKVSLETFFNKNPQELEYLLGKFEEYRKKLDSKKLKSNGTRFATKFTKLRDCSSVNGELYVCEGDSAGGSILACRNPQIHAVLPLKGKIPSIVNAEDILKNQEIGELIQSLGTGVNSHFDLSKLKYDKVICATDADDDGKHIFCLLTIILANVVPDIIKHGHYYLAQTPLYAINKGKTFIPIWNEDSLKKAKEKNESITRFKGLGELSPWQLKIALVDEKTRHLTRVHFTTDLPRLMKLFSDVNQKRLLLDGKFSMEEKNVGSEQERSKDETDEVSG
jgi:DNA gyrase subunit B